MRPAGLGSVRTFVLRAAAESGKAHSSQNFDPCWILAPQFEHFAEIDAAQSLQNFASSRFSVPHFAQRMFPVCAPYQ
jgi:hypothetical protein